MANVEPSRSPLYSIVATPKAFHHPKCPAGKRVHAKCACDKAAVDKLLAEWWENNHLDVADDIGLAYKNVSDKNAEVFVDG
jgi:hypothetical protein